VQVRRQPGADIENLDRNSYLVLDRNFYLALDKNFYLALDRNSYSLLNSLIHMAAAVKGHSDSRTAG